MPEYEFECRDCNANKSIWQGMAEKLTNPTCDECSKDMNRVWAKFGTIFNGTERGKGPGSK